MKIKNYIIVIIALFLNQILLAQTFEVDGIAYSVISNIEPYEVEVTVKQPNYEGDIVIPEEVFYDDITYSITKIGNSAFSDADGLTSIVMPNSINEISDFSFYSCSALHTILFSNTLTKIGLRSFYSCSFVNSFNLPNTLDSICEGAFMSCLGFNSFIVPESVSYIGDNTFLGCKNLETILIPGSVTSIGSNVFSITWNLDSIIVDENNQFYSSVDGVLFNQDTTSLLEFPGGRTGTYYMPNKVRRIECKAFHCRKIDRVVFSDSLEYIGVEAFSSCYQLDSIFVNANVDLIDIEAFSMINTLTKIDVSELNPNFSSLDGVLFNKNKTTLIQYPGGKMGSYTVPNGVNRIGYKAFLIHLYLNSVQIPNSVDVIEDYSFYKCEELLEINFTNGLDSIGEYAFAFNSSLESIILPNTVTHVGSFAFCNCYSLRSCQLSENISSVNNSTFSSCYSLDSIEVPYNVSYIGSGAFGSCEELRSIKIKGNVDSIGSGFLINCINLDFIACCSLEAPDLGCYAFYNVPYGIPLYVPNESIDSYQNAIQWCNFNVTGVNDCQSITKLRNINTAISVYPNPFSNNIIFDSFDVSQGYLKLYNAHGKIVLSTEINNSSEVNTENLSSGIYFYKIILSNEFIVTGKVIKN